LRFGTCRTVDVNSVEVLKIRCEVTTFQQKAKGR
jgi:hypothetical protein